MELVVEEELPVGSRIGDVHAIDEDEGDNAVIDYAIIGEFNRVLILIPGWFMTSSRSQTLGHSYHLKYPMKLILNLRSPPKFRANLSFDNLK